MNYFSTQGWVYIVISIIFTIIALILNIYMEGIGLYMLAYLLYILVILITAYNITCLTSGECHMWSWIVTILSTLPMILIIILVIYGILTGSN
uniref:Uncharacterized protein n=1 Tax=Virus NIOZ-UU159 TaxID=2763270 RepID=A0A7S9SUM7_9VIRU|nr:MAG: hypothetical protein NIOZUU159_00353 [Virus NIOZ-UU159]|tara:strand:+ start:2191 stop:2469 length:279 start_codon:yes stop_codon:yes gene_type:complete